jgi:hypothetical protein
MDVTPALRWLDWARCCPGAWTRISDTRVRPMPAVTNAGTPLSVKRDSADRPVQDQGVATAVCRGTKRARVM